MFAIGLGIAAILFAAGLATYSLAPRVGPNPVFGVRVGYSFASREVWDKTNRAGGLALALIGLGVALAILLLQLFDAWNSQGFLFVMAAMTLALSAVGVWSYGYARSLASGLAIVQQTAPVRFRWVFLAPTLVSYALLVALAVYFFPQLPAERVASHFDLYGRADGWMSREAFTFTYLGLAGVFVLLDLLVVGIALREPLIAFARWGANWQLQPEGGLILFGLALASTNIILGILLVDVYWFNTRGAHLFPLSLLLLAVPALIALFVGLFFLLARREGD